MRQTTGVNGSNKIRQTARHMPKTSWAYAGTERKGKKVGNMEKKLKREDIDRITKESFIEAGGGEIDSQFMGNLKKLEAAFKEDGVKDEPMATMFLSSIMTAQANAINTMRGVLYKLFCGETEEPNTAENGNTGGNEDVLGQ